MRYIQIQLYEASFWGIPEIDLFLCDKSMSPIVDLKTLEKHFYDTIKESYKTRKIKILDIDNNKIAMPAYEQIDSNIADISDTEEDEEEVIYDIVSVTVSDKEDELEKTTIEPSVKDYEKANILLTKNGNTIRKIIKNLNIVDSSLLLLVALKELEEQNKNRVGVLKEINSKLGEINGQ